MASMNYIKRAIEHEIARLLPQGKVIVVYGPRQSGKTTMVRHIVEERKLDALWLDADMADVRRMLTELSPEKWESILGGRRTLIIDEAQRVEDIGIALKILIDNIKGLRVIVTGSSALELKNRTEEPLTGRKFDFLLLPPSFAELSGMSDALSEIRSVEDRLVYGSYPDVLSAGADRERVLRSLASSYLYKDLLSLDGIVKSAALEKLTMALAFQIGSEVSYQELADTVGIDRKTAEKYVDLLKRCFVVFEVGAYSRNLRNEIRKSRKFYFHDVGVRNAVIGNLLPLASRSGDETGHLWENYVIAERFKRNVNLPTPPRAYFWRTKSGQEIDYIEESNGGIVAWEIKWNARKARGSLPSAFRAAYPGTPCGFISRENLPPFLLA
ncbi:MAG: ATP-binding protein [Kiritimatiellae bacterium]|nr:ATP-binding protein [Kiritimatiellia bacterium]